ncbi:MAG: glycosylase [Planctomycetaceae bacterium]
MLVLILVTAVEAAEPAFPPELTRFQLFDDNPVFAGAPSEWDAKIRERGWILRDGDKWRLWYTGYDGTREGTKFLGLATSGDGLHWTRHAQNPIYDAGWVEDMMIVRHDGRFFMFAEGRDDQAQLLASSDGIRWRRVGPLDIRLADGSPVPPGPLGTPTAFFEDGTWHLFYERRDAAVWLATSCDMQTWTNVSDEPVLRPGPEAYDSSRIAVNQVVKHEGRYYALYHGTDDRDSPALWTSNLAVSDDLRTWTKYSRNPLFPKSVNRSSNLLVPATPGRFRLYTMHGRVEAFLPAAAE